MRRLKRALTPFLSRTVFPPVTAILENEKSLETRLETECSRLYSFIWHHLDKACRKYIYTRIYVAHLLNVPSLQDGCVSPRGALFHKEYFTLTPRVTPHIHVPL